MSVGNNGEILNIAMGLNGACITICFLIRLDTKLCHNGT